VPDAVVINLGTNDFHGWPTSDRAFLNLFASAYLEFVKLITSDAVYGKNAHLFLAVGPMTTSYLTPVQWVLQNATALGINAHVLNQSHFAHGNCGHPSWQTDAAMAVQAQIDITPRLSISF
jgi:hypothetical protein